MVLAFSFPPKWLLRSNITYHKARRCMTTGSSVYNLMVKVFGVIEGKVRVT